MWFSNVSLFFKFKNTKHKNLNTFIYPDILYNLNPKIILFLYYTITLGERKQ